MDPSSTAPPSQYSTVPLNSNQTFVYPPQPLQQLPQQQQGFYVAQTPMDPYDPQQQQQQQPLPQPFPQQQQQSFGYNKLPEEVNQSGVIVTPFGVESCNIAEEITAQDYEVNISKWYHDAWHIYKQHWIAFTIFTIFQIAVGWLPYVGSVLSIPLSFGVFLAVTNKIRYNGPNGDMRYDHFLFGFLFLLPLLLIALFSFIIIGLGFLLCILPGFYALIVLSFSIPIFLEYHHQKVGMIGSMQLSVKVINKHLVEMALFFLVNFLFMLSGLLLLGVGLIITIPMSSITFALAFKDLFGLNPTKEQETSCVLC